MMKLTRRKFALRMTGAFAAAIPAAAFLTGCGGKQGEEQAPAGDKVAEVKSCDDLTGVPESDLELRKKFAYVKESPIPESHCSNCNLYLPPKEGSKCGGCMLFKGPVFATGYCTYWAPKVES